MQDNVPTGRHGWAELLTLVGAARRLAFDTSLPAAEAMGRIRDAFADYNQGGVQLRSASPDSGTSAPEMHGGRSVCSLTR